MNPDEVQTNIIESLQKKAESFMSDKNRIAKAIAVILRNCLEVFHGDNLSDEQMKSFNPLIRGAIYSFLVDYGDDYTNVDSEDNVKKCRYYIYAKTLEFLHNEGVTNLEITKFCNIIDDHIYNPLHDLAQGGAKLSVCEFFDVPDYWEDCIYYKIKI